MGVLAALEKRGMLQNMNAATGCSSSGLVASWLAAGKKPSEFLSSWGDEGFNKFKDERSAQGMATPGGDAQMARNFYNWAINNLPETFDDMAHPLAITAWKWDDERAMHSKDRT